MQTDNNLWLERAISKLYEMKDEHNKLMKDFDDLRQKLFIVNEDLKKVSAEVKFLRKKMEELSVVI